MRYFRARTDPTRVATSSSAGSSIVIGVHAKLAEPLFQTTQRDPERRRDALVIAVVRVVGALDLRGLDVRRAPYAVFAKPFVERRSRDAELVGDAALNECVLVEHL